MPAWFTPRRLLWTLVLGLALAFLSYGVVASRSPDDGYDRGYVAGQLASHNKLLASRRDSSRANSVAAETVYVAKRAASRQAVGAVPPVTVSGDTITFADDSSFAIPHRVAQLIVEQRDAISGLGTALNAADSLLAKFRVERDASDSLLVGVQKERDALAERVRVLSPGRLSRAWDSVRTPVTLVAGIALGAYVTTRVSR